jgi:xylose isomerase
MSLFSDLPAVRYGGPDTTDEFQFRAYDAKRSIMGRSMGDWLRCAVCYWHSFNWPGADIFGAGTLPRPWLGAVITREMAESKLEAAFDFLERLGVPFFAFHDVDAMATATSLPEHERNLREIESRLAQRMQSSGVRLLWGTANLFSHPRYAAGAATNPNPEVFAWAASQVKWCLESTHRLGGQNYVLWGGREGYDTLLNTDLRREMDQYGRFLSLVVEHKHRIGFKGAILIEPKPFEPTKHQYDRDVAGVYAFLQRYQLEKEVAVNIEVNHATLAGLDFEHEVAAAMASGIFGSIDMNRGDPRNGWDTDQFPNNAQDLVPAMISLMEAGGFTTGGFNFDAKIRRQSVDPLDLYRAHIAGMDTLARALTAAAKVIEGRRLSKIKSARYAGWQGEFGRKILDGQMTLDSICQEAVQRNWSPPPQSGLQELCEAIIADAM